MKSTYSTVFQLVSLLLAAGVTAPAAPAEVPARRSTQLRDGFGVNLNLPRQPRLPWDRRWWTRLFDSGVKWVRLGQYENSSDLTSWDWVEQTRGSYKVLADVDEAIRSLVENGISVQIQLCYSNRLYQGDPATRPASASPWSGVIDPKAGEPLFKGPSTADEIEGFLGYVRYMVARYRGKVRGWEFWNEPNHFFWQPVPENDEQRVARARLYGQVLSRFADVVHAADPEAKVIVGGTSSVDLPFTLTALADCVGKVDVVAYHSYPGFGRNRPPEEAETVVKAAALRKAVRGLAGARPTLEFWDNEWNSIPSWKNSNESVQARYVPRFLLHSRAHGVTPFIWEFIAGTDGTEGDQFGLLHGDTQDQNAFQPRPALRAFETTSAIFGQTTVDPASEVVLTGVPPDFEQGLLRKYCFRDKTARKSIYAFWLAIYSDPADNFVPLPVDLKVADRAIANPILIDLRTGGVSALAWRNKGERTVRVPLRDSVMAVADASIVDWPKTPETPGELRLARTDAELILSWKDYGEPCAHEVQESIGFRPWRRVGRVPAGVNEFRRAFTPGEHRSYRVRALGREAPSPWSNPAWVPGSR